MMERLIDSSNRALRLQAYFADGTGGPAPDVTGSDSQAKLDLQ
jgi:hypothetical protein